MKDQLAILNLLRRIGARLWLNRALNDLGFVVSAMLFTLIAFRLVQPALVRPAADVALPVFLVALIGLGGYLLWRVVRPPSQMLAAGAADDGANLKDELKSACWFISQGQDSPFSCLQLARAAVRAEGLSPRQLVPFRIPRSCALVAMLALALVITDRSVSMASRDWVPDLAREAEDLQSEESLRALLEGAPADVALEQLDRALAMLERDDVADEDAQQAALDAREAVDAVNMRAVAAREGLARLAEAMQGRPGYEQVARALNEGRTEEAMELLEKLKADAAPGESTAKDPAINDQTAEGVRSEKEFSQALEDSTRALGHLTATVNEEALNRVLENIEAAQNMLEAQNRAREVNRRMNDFLAASTQRSSLTASRFGNRANPSNPTPSPETGSTTMQGGTMFRQGAVARGDDDQASNEGNKAGAASGHSAADPLENVATERLDAKLQRETIRFRDQVAQDDAQGDKSWFYSPTEAAGAETGLTDVRGRDAYARADAMNPETIPIRQRRLVKEYFINLHESEKR